MVQKGLLIVLSGPSGAGKGTVCKALLPHLTETTKLSVSCTTRQPREGEVEGVNYFFKTKDEFRGMVDNDQMLEWAEVYGNYYGTPRQYVEEMLESGHNVFLEIEMQGALQVRKQFPSSVLIFLVPPSLEELRSRILGRGSETEETFNQRFGAAADEMKYISQYDYAVVNDEVENAVEKIRGIIHAELCSVTRNLEYYNSLIQEGNKA